MIAVADTSPLNYLILMDQAEVLPFLFQGVLLPGAVHDELLDARAPAKVRRWLTDPPAWIQFTRTSPGIIINGLDPGESEAIHLAQTLQADWLLMDELAGRQEARQRGLHTIGTVGILRDAHLAGLLDFQTATSRLRQLGFHVKASVVTETTELLKRLDHK